MVDEEISNGKLGGSKIGQSKSSLETMLIHKKTTIIDSLSEAKGCYEKLRRFFSRNTRLITRRRLTTDKEGNPIGSQMA